ncbi:MULTISPECIES: telomere-protecting terminal protein Tpg [unclassified Streptomyces]|uniref:telomere-protecting terminal protein Tpg n=1 Tax=unclassified Streptomyces TaxID=2593676 RepID=UPI002E2C4D19|nr:XRE family transcriptional regulator [Streptomyces sp. NBC_01423]WSX95701.1 XRE family transcriptional regulator [Streptomyces sp. NBC_00891]WSY10181.1 XRE family transcriptional regulator [Streptomyces sp. NBC_00890]WSZ11685.1 XRE family transcriptional regulator [Streptomyces sp. NBC_00869]WSZ27909.1 XRE family transcriptional regulator [Streptomyces sp. NBC_00870]
MNTVGEGLDEAVQRAFTRPAPKSAGAQMRYLVKQLKGTRAVAALLGVTQRTVERYVRDQLKKPRPDLAARMDREVKRRWQPQIQAKARKAAATTDGIVIDTRARFGYTAAPGSTDDARLRHLTVALPPTYAARLFETRERGGSDRQLQEIAAEGLQEIYFKDGGRRAQGLLVEYTDLEHVAFDL